MTEPVLSPFVPTKCNMRAVYFLSPEITVVWGLLVCVMHKVALMHIDWHVTFQAKIRLMTRKSIARLG